MVRKTKRKLPDPAQIDEAEKQIREYSRTVKFTVVGLCCAKRLKPRLPLSPDGLIPRAR